MTQDERLKLIDVVEGKMKDIVKKKQKIKYQEAQGRVLPIPSWR